LGPEGFENYLAKPVVPPEVGGGGERRAERERTGEEV
jgi:hypothetical protein